MMLLDLFLDDIDECTDSNPCDPNAICTNTDGSFSCACKLGFIGDGLSCGRCITHHLVSYHRRWLLSIGAYNKETGA